jgi:hypothetical protein
MRYCSQDYRGEVDFFGVYCPETDRVNLVPVEAVGKWEGFLRIDATKNKQSKRIRWAAEYELKAPG